MEDPSELRSHHSFPGPLDVRESISGSGMSLVEVLPVHSYPPGDHPSLKTFIVVSMLNPCSEDGAQGI